MTPLPLMLAVVAPLSGSIADRLRSRWLSPIGLAKESKLVIRAVPAPLPVFSPHGE